MQSTNKGIICFLFEISFFMEFSTHVLKIHNTRCIVVFCFLFILVILLLQLIIENIY